MVKMEEQWKPITWIADIPIDKYSISSYGRIRNEYTNHIRKNWTRNTGVVVCLISNSPRRRKAKRIINSSIILPDDEFFQHKEYFITIHTQVAKAFLPPPDLSNPDMIISVIHKDGNLQNNHADNLDYDYRLSHKVRRASDIKRNQTLSVETVRRICELLILENGKLKNVRKHLPLLPNVSIEQVESIKYKMHYKQISDEYFIYCDRKFIPLKK